MSALYFDYINDVLHAATQETSGFSCKPPPCLDQTTGTLLIQIYDFVQMARKLKQLSSLLVGRCGFGVKLWTGNVYVTLNSSTNMRPEELYDQKLH